MASDLDPEQVEITGRYWFIGELVRARLEAADTVRDNGVDLLVSAAHYSWIQPILVKTSRDRDINVYPNKSGRSRLGAEMLIRLWKTRAGWVMPVLNYCSGCTGHARRLQACRSA